jgi:hypothetical protein
MNRPVCFDVDTADNQLLGVREPNGTPDGGDSEIGYWLGHHWPQHSGAQSVTGPARVLPANEEVWIIRLFWDFSNKFSPPRALPYSDPN